MSRASEIVGRDFQVQNTRLEDLDWEQQREAQEDDGAWLEVVPSTEVTVGPRRALLLTVDVTLRSWACFLAHCYVCSGAWMHAAVCSQRSLTLPQIGSWISLTTPLSASRNHCYWARNVTHHFQIYLLHFVVVLNGLRMHMHWLRWWGFSHSCSDAMFTSSFMVWFVSSIEASFVPFVPHRR
jgi:small-conductance mechanosensitive channel